MPELLAGDIGWLGGALLFAWLLGALAQLATAVAPRAPRDVRGPKPRCGHRRDAARRQAVRTRVTCVAMLLAAPLILSEAGASHFAHAAASTGAGALCGAWLARRPRPARVHGLPVSITGCVAGSAVLAGGLAVQLSFPPAGVLERGALYLAVSFGAFVLAAAASLRFVGIDRDRRHGAYRRATRATFDERITYGLALTLGVALAYGFVTAEASPQFRFAALIAAAGLAAAVGVRWIAGPHAGAALRSLPAAGLRSGTPRPDGVSWVRPGLAGIPEELLVAACGGETFDAACLLPVAAHGPGRFDAHHAGVPALPRRRRSRYGGTARHDGGRAR
ncbi:hypothetical protein C7405_108193 [Paraburkholderia caballeronis]|uniref:hypothetical protein n=1 Tax=Paraburkholderia caballeronis TaxID=416943 RepID=UPI0010667866|nr:hypothetical protein [Paraburkholderia caballeronis]TDV34462.1 hypothetical protein C7405_108193 [Paraburkholderia caballeronis]